MPYQNFGLGPEQANAAISYKPNIVVIMVDDHDERADHILLQEGLMPNLKHYLVDEGVTFSESFASYPLCCPSRATFLTGQYPHNHNVWNNNLPLGGVSKLDDSSTLATWLQDAGYYTANIGKYLNRYGQDTAENYIPPGWNSWQTTVGASTYWMYSYTINDNGLLVKYGENDYQTDELAKRSVKLINERESDDSTPFFLYINPLAPHNDGKTEDCTLNYGALGTTKPHPRHIGKSDGIEFPQPPSFNEEDVSDKPKRDQHLPLDSSHVQCFDDMFHDRLESMMAVDDLIGVVMNALRDNDEDETVVVYTSDNGFLLGEHRLHGKQFVYEESIRLPLYMRIPEVTPRIIDGLVLNNDLAPTFLEFAQAEADIPVDGRSLVPLIDDPSIPWRHGVLVEDNLYSAIRAKDYVYVAHNNGARELYDLKNDPYQLDNLNITSLSESDVTELEDWRVALTECEGTTCQTVENREAPVLFAEDPAATCESTVANPPLDSRYPLKDGESSYQIGYTAVNSNLTSMKTDVDKKSVVAEVSSTDDGCITVLLPTFVIDAEDKFRVNVNDQPATFREIDDGPAGYRTLHIPLEEGTSEVEIIGTRIVPEFDLLGLVLGIGVVAVIMASKRMQLFSRS